MRILTPHLALNLP